MPLNLNDASLLRQQCYVDGAWIDASGGATVDVTNPAPREVLGTVPKLGAAETRAAIEAAHAAFPAWAARTAKDRAALLRKWHDLMLANADDLAVLMTAEQGKPLAEARGEVLYAAAFIEWFAEEGKRLYGDVIPGHQPDKRIFVLRQPVGVVAAITPWNFPAAMITRKAGPALAAGCTFVCKPAMQTPYSALAMAELAERAGIPRGVFNVITGPSSALGGEMTSNPIVRKVTFTGSTEVGKKLMAQCAGTLKKLSLELGGNAPFIVFDDADLDDAVDGAMVAKMRNMGEACTAANRIFVQRGIAEEFSRRLAQRMGELVFGAGVDDGVQVGPLVGTSALAKVEELVGDAVSRGARVVVGGERPERPGYFYPPTVLADVSPDSALMSQEIFGPVAPLITFDTEDEVVEMANDTAWGLVGYVYTRDVERAFRVSEEIEVGMMGLNTGLVSNPAAPFGGVKSSGLGREGGRVGIEEVLEIKDLAMPRRRP